MDRHATTNPTPASSAPVGTWRSTTRPITVAVAGSRAPISAYVARLSRAVAGWSHT
ncbi:hypothetical protein [Actinomadura sp. KC345]|uniref:hypothetical protein n=1 Tax=Actinomadura sp. KC345 TaxID=2530371 RepID=UPI001A9F9A5A|nr:hypothetical protein [Actinomadura sp. KC345]